MNLHKKIFFGILLNALFVLSSLATNDVELFSGEMYFVAKETITVAWDLSPDSNSNDIYEVASHWIDPSSNMYYAITNVNGLATNVIVPRIRTGHFEYRVRLVDIQMVTNVTGAGTTNEVINIESITNYSDWCSSNSSNAWQKTAKTNGPWIIYWKVPPPTGIVIE